jgi:lysyl-tRNA synthetase class 2
MVRIGPVFRAEESGRLHNPEFTMIEWYRLGFDLAQLMDEVAALVDQVLGMQRSRRSRITSSFTRGRGSMRSRAAQWIWSLRSGDWA